MSTQRRSGRVGGIGFTFADGMTPMIDVVFLLMIFFLAVARLSEARLIRVELPGTARDQPVALEREPEAAVINITPDGAAVINGRRIDGGSDAVEAALGRALGAQTGGVVWVRADRAAPAAAVVRATGAAERVLASRGGGTVRFTSVEGGA